MINGSMSEMKDWSSISSKLHRLYKGKISMMPKVPIRDVSDFSWLYTPGVAGPCKEIAKDPELSWELTSRWNTVAVISDGSRTLGLGNIGPEASIPVLEGKAILFKYLGGVDAFPLAVRANDADKMVELLKIIEPSFGGINLEDIAKPKCFEILERSRKELKIPVWHDDQQGTATVVYAGLRNALKLVNKKLTEVKILFVGFGAANKKTAEILLLAGARPENIYIVDSKGLLGVHRKDVIGTYKEWWALNTNPDGREGGIDEAIKGVDVVIAMSRPGPGILKKEHIKMMGDNPIVFALANPIPEIWPWQAKEAGAKIVATGRSDFPNQINNSLSFPAIFRGVLDVRAITIPDELCVKAGEAIAEFAERRESNENYIVPRMTDWELYPFVASVVAEEASKLGIARRKLSREQEFELAREIISSSRKQLDSLLKSGLIKVYE